MTELASTAADCACGSGLRAVVCCSAPTREIAPGAGDPATPGPDVRALLALARTARGQGDPAAALHCIQILDRDPLNLDALRLLADIHRSENKASAVIALLTRVIDRDPADGKSINALAMLHLGRGDAAAAEPLARAMIRLSPKHAQAHNLMAMAMTEQQRAVLGEYHCRKALELAGSRIPLVLANLATNLFHQGRVEEARTLYREADEADPNNRRTLLSWARLEEADRQLDAADALLDRLDSFNQNDPAVLLLRVAILQRRRRVDEAIRMLDDAVAARQRPARPIERMERGRLLDRVDRHAEAWAEFVAAKAEFVELSGHSYRKAEAEQMAMALKSIFTRETLEDMPRAQVRKDVAQPIFVLGFPRSGTTLLEQTLSGSPLIAAGDELPLIQLLTGIMPRLFDSPHPYPAAMAQLWMGDHREGLDELRDVYLKRARQMGAMPDGARWFTDKMPLNEMHMGLIGMVFPAAPLLHVVRHPLDIMVSAMSNFFSHGLDCGSALETAAQHLVLSAEMIDHYRSQMDLNYRVVRYEDMVGAQEATIREVFDFVGAPFDPRVLSFETNPRYARTASYQQVTEKLYDRSRYRYRRYLEGLAPVIPLLTPLIEKLGYTVEPG